MTEADHARGTEPRLALLLATNGGLGLAPVASGTFGTLAGIPAFWLLSHLGGFLYTLAWLLLLVIAVRVSDRAGRYYGVADDGRIVIDELLGYLVTVALLPFSWTAAILGFLFFRLFDIAKLPPASWFDREMKNGLGVVLDDVAAGIYAALALRFCLAIFT
ncbi:phosphatidylglycerophosphatase A [Geothermobacter hydrogeniphilus]|uniref:Phosphatidylglycerophosphatase A n=1 Tax=Geothermobacter hydrogeniphilus TaxID=1969733 RepID=A0A2K2H6W6_9BACT|nr:phosphatidylglycerophosphatase A [Geothermobacter hydrogeniphilus]PNU18990.1 phosphatidylglycerophosphatase A [Geothermobacter hydrogeniphilus]